LLYPAGHLSGPSWLPLSLERSLIYSPWVWLTVHITTYSLRLKI
jgi:hypothetical protein